MGVSMKLITFVIPCYNSAEYMGNCIDSILNCQSKLDNIEILVVDDGSQKDNTFEIAKSYEEKNKGIVRAIHKENGGHGSVINVGIKEANGMYFKVVDSDDKVDPLVVEDLINAINKNINENNNVDLYITDFIYDKVDKINKKVMEYSKYIEENKVITWDDIKTFHIGHYLLMHSLMYKTSLLRDNNIHMPEKTFYEDNVFAYIPLQYVKNLYYIHKTLYYYYIGRSDQSVNQEIMISRLSQQYGITRVMLYEVDLKNVFPVKLRDYMASYMQIVMAITTSLSLVSNDEKWINEKNNLWDELKIKDNWLYEKLTDNFIGKVLDFRTIFGENLVKTVYNISQKLVGFN